MDERNRLRIAVVIFVGLAALGVADASAATTTLYDGSTDASPAAGGYLFSLFTGGTPTVGSGNGQTSVDTTSSDAIKGGYSNTLPIVNTLVNPAFPVLDNSSGYSVTLDATVIDESSASPNRSGFDLIVAGADASGIELDFTTTSVFAQNVGFTAGESANFDTTTATAYTLNVLGDDYTLLADGLPLLSGALRDYGVYPYTLDNYLFLGDDTTEAGASWAFSELAVAVPEPGILSVVAALVAVGPGARRRGGSHRR